MRPPGFRHAIYGALVVPRPIGWVTTLSADGIVNLAPFSFSNLVASDPLCFMYCANGSHREGGAKDSLLNAEATGEFVFNLCTWDLREQMNATSASSPRSVDEMRATGIEAAPSIVVRPPRVAASPIALECAVVEIVRLPSSEVTANAMVVGRVVQVHVADEAVVDGVIDVAGLRPLGRLGYQDYAVVEQAFSMTRPA
ncbi:MAG: flavin reductase family protein [Acidimicrobiia bacterium]|nr:flavin reductase family protein [Acidimicrobiia bacterium]